MVNFRGPLIRALAARGLTVLALAPDYDARTRAEVRALGAEPVDFALSRAGMNPFADGVAAIGLAVLLRRLRADVSFAYSVKPVIYGTLGAWAAGVPRRHALIEGLGYVFVDAGDGLPAGRRLLRWAVLRLYALALGRAAKVFFVNADDAGELAAAGALDPGKAVNLGGIGLDLAEWPQAPAVEKPLTFLLVARLLAEKGIREYVAAARQVKAAHPDVRFRLAGSLDSNPGGISGEEADAWAAEGIVEWAGHVPVRPWLAEASVFVLPSYRARACRAAPRRPWPWGARSLPPTCRGAGTP